MKSFFKKLSLVLAAAMVITMLPLQGAKAATAITVGLSGDSKNPNPSAVTLNVGDTQSWKFTGVDKYNAAGAATKKWNSSDPTVVSVNNGAIKALKAGTAKITLQLTNNGIQYAGTTTVTVVDPKAAGEQTIGNVSAKQTAYNAITLTFADKATAEAAKDKIVVERVKASAIKDWYLNVRPDKTVDENKIIISGSLSDQVTYRITVPGVANPFFISMSVGEPTDLILEYPTVYVGSGLDIEGNPIKQPTVTPIVKVVDANGVEVNKGTNKVTFTTDKTRNSYVTFTQNTGKLKFSSINGEAYVKAQYKFTNAAKETITLTDDITVTPVAYQAPNLQGFVESICLTKETNPKNVVYPTNYEFKGELAIGETKYIAYYFESTDGVKYTGKNVAKTSASSDLKIKTINNDTDYKFYFTKDDSTATKVSLVENADGTVQVRGWNEGTERICLYKQADKSKRDTTVDALVGVIDVKVDAEPYVLDMGLAENSADGFINGLKTEVNIPYAFQTQYQEKIAGKVKLTKADGGSLDWAEVWNDQNGHQWVDGVEYKQADGKGVIHIDFTKLGKTDGTELKVTVENQVPEYSEIITVSAGEINTNGSVSYELEVKSNEIKNKNLTSAAEVEKIGTTIRVVELRDGNPLKYVDFAMVRNEDFGDITPSVSDLLYVTVVDSDDKIVKKDATSAEFATTTATVDQGSFDSMKIASSIAGYKFDGYNNDATASSIGDGLLTGSFVAYLYRTTAGIKGGFDTENTADFSLTNNAELLQKTNNTYSLTVKDNAVKVQNDNAHIVWADGRDAGVVTPAHYETLIASIVGELYTWVDLDSNGKVDDGATEIMQIKNLTGVTIDTANAKYQPGANDKHEIYIKSVNVSFRLGAGCPIVTKTIDVDRKYTYK